MMKGFVLTVVAMMAAAGVAEGEDVYAIKDDAERLAALKRKWVAAGDRISQWEMPEKLAQWLKIDKFQDWCEENPVERYPRFEVACRDAIAMKIQPAVWYYNLACICGVGGRKDEALEALEQAVAAGCCNWKHAAQDSDLASVSNEVRFAALCNAMRAHRGRKWSEPEEALDLDASPFPVLTEKNVYYGFHDARYTVDAVTTNQKTVVYLNGHVNHPEIPADGLVCPVYEEAAKRRGRDKGLTDIGFGRVPTITASDYRFDEESGESSMSIPAALAVYAPPARSVVLGLFEDNVLGVYAVGDEYDRTDMSVGSFPGCVAHAGGAEESDKFVALLAEMMRELTVTNGERAAYRALDILRRAQKCVGKEEDLMTGLAQRPVLRYEDIDAKRAVEIAKTGRGMVVQPLLERNETGFVGDPMPVTDLWTSPWDHPHLSSSAMNASFVAHGGDYTGHYAAGVVCLDPGARVEWRVLQGDPKKIRIVPQDASNTTVKIEVDYHAAFEVEAPGGRKLKTSRVDIGCFAVKDGIVSLPSVVSVFFNPNETRVYDENHRLVSIDYTKRQIEEYCPYLCAKGDWKDIFEYDAENKMTGWTRFIAHENGEVTTNRFTRGGLVIDMWDELGRPKDVHRSLRSTWLQDLGPSNLLHDASFKRDYITYKNNQYDANCATLEETTLAWKYTYEDEQDRFGKPSPKDPVPFRYRPEVCRRIDFSESSGFRLPLANQMEFGYYRHVAYRNDTLDEDPYDLTREDHSRALKRMGLVPPKTLKQMRFCPWKPSTNDVWTCDLSDDEKSACEDLFELADGVYRYRTGDDGSLSVGVTSCLINDRLARSAYGLLDSRYARLHKTEVKEVMPGLFVGDAEESLIVSEEGFVRACDLTEEKSQQLAMWKIRDGLYLSVFMYRDDRNGRRHYTFLNTTPEHDEELSLFYFVELPSPAVGNAMLSALDGDPAALNNVAVLIYGGIIDGHKYDEERVIVLLEAAARGGCAAAKYNLGVLSANRGERNEAARYYEEARVMGYR